jgi:hypothetical protein
MLIRHHSNARATVGGPGFARPDERHWLHQRRKRVLAQLITTAALAVCLLIAMLAVSAGLARQYAAGPHIELSHVELSHVL